MGCNTSKETVPQEEKTEQQHEELAKTEDVVKIKLTDNENAETGNHVEDPSDSKPASAKTITLRSNGSATVTADQDQNKSDSKQSSNATVKDETNNKEDPAEEERAATKIQAAFRGHTTRKSMKQPTGKVEPTTAASREPTRDELEAEFRMDDEELCNAATKIQASFRGHMTRKNKEDGKKDDESSTSQAKDAKEEELDIDLTDPELNKAAVKIQATFRGHMNRKDEKETN